MQNVQNIFTVENLVAKYRDYVNEHCPKEYVVGEGNDGKMADDYIPFSPDGNSDEQLLVTLYHMVCGDGAEKEILTALAQYEEKFYKDALSSEELAFLRDRFKEVVSYEFEHRREWLFHSAQSISKERVRLVHEYVKPQKGSTVFIADTEYCDLAVQFPGCIVKGFTGYNYHQKEVWALGQIRMFAAGIKSEIVSGEEVDGEYKYSLPEKNSIDFVIFRVNENKYFAQHIFGTECTDIEALYKLLKPDGIMLFFSELGRIEFALHRHQEIVDFRKLIVKEKAISSIVSYKDAKLLGKQDNMTNYVMLVVKNATNDKVCIKDEPGNLVKYIDSQEIDDDVMWPSFYFAHRPVQGTPLSSLVDLVDEEELAIFVKGQGYILPEQAQGMQLVLSNALGENYKDANLWNKPAYNVTDPAFTESDWIDFYVVRNPCILVSGSKDNLKVGYTMQVPENGFAYSLGCCFIPKEGVDVRYVAALLFEPSVRAQILTICEGDFGRLTMSLILDKIKVPNHDDKERLSFLSEANYDALLCSQKEMEKDFEEKLAANKAQYINEVRMRKHDMRPHLRQLASSERLMLHYIDNASEMVDLKKNLRNQIEHIHVALTSISAIVDHLSDEEQFGKPELLNVDSLLTDIEINHDEDEGFVIEYDCDKESFRKHGFVIPNLLEQWELAEEQGHDIATFIQAKSKENLPLFVSIAPVDFQRLVDNIIENARKHGFTDHTRTDYYIGIVLGMNTERNMYQIDFCNNGNPLPKGMDKNRFGMRGVKAGLTGDSGNGGYIIKSIVSHYGGDYDVFTDNDTTTIRIFLPISRI